MKKLSHRGMTAMASAAIALTIVLLPSTAQAASTRAEYIAQVDPICKSFEAPLLSGFKAYHRNFKTLNRKAKTGPPKAFLKALRRTAGSLNAIAGLHANKIAQIAGVPPVAADTAVINTWLNALRQEQSYEVGAAAALLHFKIGQFFKQLNLADGAVNAADNAILGFGFTVCGVTVT